MDDADNKPLNQNYYITPSNTKTIDVYLTGAIKGPHYYLDCMHVIRTANPEDEVNIYINSPGGRLDTAVQFINAMSYSPASIHIHIDDECISAATFIAMHGDTYTVNPHARFMFHNYSGGAVGKGGEIYDNAVFMRQWIETYYTDIYKDFLTDQEIADILAGKDHYMVASEFVERIQRKKDNQTKLMAEADQNPLARFSDPELVDILHRLMDMTFGEIDSDMTASEFISWLTSDEFQRIPFNEAEMMPPVHQKPKKSRSKKSI